MSAAAGETPRKGWLRRLTLPQIAALVAAISGIVTLVFVFKPGWKPQAPADKGAAEISQVKVFRPVTFRRYYQLNQLSPGTMSPSYLDREGVLIRFRYEATGFRGKELPIGWELIDTKTNDAVLSSRSEKVEPISIRPSTNDDARNWFVWVPVPKTKKQYYVTVTLYQPPEGQVAVPLQPFDTAPFYGLAARKR